DICDGCRAEAESAHCPEESIEAGRLLLGKEFADSVDSTPNVIGCRRHLDTDETRAVGQDTVGECPSHVDTDAVRGNTVASRDHARHVSPPQPLGRLRFLLNPSLSPATRPCSAYRTESASFVTPRAAPSKKTERRRSDRSIS